MKNDFDELCESVSNILRHTQTFRYPRQIQLSEEFMRSLRKEVNRHLSIIDESKGPIRQLPVKFLKALRFELVDLTEKKVKNTKKKAL